MHEGEPHLVVVVSGPSGVGKDAVVDRLLAVSDRLVRPVTMTTRPPRPGEFHGREYVFATVEEFERHIEANELLEHASIYGNLYGLPRAQLRRALDAGDALVRIDVQGVASLRKIVPDAVYVMLVPDSIEHLERRLRARGEAHDEEDLQRRLREAERELAHHDLFDHIVVNVEGDLETAVDRVLEIVASERARADRAPATV